MGEMRIMDKDAGDLKVVWDATKQHEVDAAKKQFEELKRKGYVAYAVKKDGEKGKKVDEFDPDEEKMILAPAPKPGCIGRIACPPAP